MWEKEMRPFRSRAMAALVTVVLFLGLSASVARGDEIPTTNSFPEDPWDGVIPTTGFPEDPWDGVLPTTGFPEDPWDGVLPTTSFPEDPRPGQTN
jgi:hypothetical protein